MSPLVHKIYLGSLSIIVVIVTFYLGIQGFSYYQTGLEERFYHTDHVQLKPGGLTGHGLGILGSVFMLIGVSTYIARKRWRLLARVGLIKHWLEFHIFLCTLGPILILFHTAFKFGGIVAVSFWSMVAVVASGVIGRFIYLQIPRSLEGRELSLEEIKAVKRAIQDKIRVSTRQHAPDLQLSLINYGQTESMQGANLFDRFTGLSSLGSIRKSLQAAGMDRKDSKEAIDLIKQEIRLSRRIGRLQTMQKIFRYWHVAHMPFALIMLIIMIIHIAVAIAFGSTWIF